MGRELLFWIVAAAGALLVVGTVLAPIWRGTGRGERRASYDLQVQRDRLREVEADLVRGVVTPAEAEASRVEISRLMLAAADAEAAESSAAASPRGLTRLLLPAISLALLLATVGLYGWLGVPGMPNQPLERREAEAAALRADRPGQVEAEAMAGRTAPAPPGPSAEDADLVTKLESVLETRPDDLQGHRLLARSLASLNRWAEARAAQERVVELMGDDAGASDLVDLAEAQIIAANGYVSPEAEAVLGRALSMEPEHPVARYYSALTLLQGGRPDLAYRLWSRLVSEGPPDAPWMVPARAGLAEAARLTGQPGPDDAPGAPAGPTSEDIRAAEDLAPEARNAMVEGMVAQLSRRLATEGGPPRDWAQLIRSLGVLGRQEEAAAILGEARATFAANAEGLELVEAAGREAGIPGAAP